MSSQSYGAQGEPISVPREALPAEPVPVAQPTGSALPGDAAVTRSETGTVKPEPHDASNETPPPAPLDADLVEANAALGARLAAVSRLVPAWEQAAGDVLIKGDRQRGQREGVLGCADELRQVLGL